VVHSNYKIAIVTGTYGATTETFVTRHVNHLNNGMTVVLCNVNDYYGDSDLEKPVFRIKKNWWSVYPGLIRKLIQLPRLIYYGQTWMPDSKQKKNIQLFLKKHRVKSVLAEFGHHGCMILPVAEEIGIPVYTYFRGYDASIKLNDLQVRYTYRNLIPRMAGIFAVSPHLLKNLKEIGVKWNQAHVIPSGTDTQLFTPGKKDPNLLLSVGRFVEKKAPDITLRAFAKMVSKYPNIRLVMVGDGPLLEKCRSLAITLGIDKSVIFTGAQPHHVVRDYMAKASFFLLHSVTDDNGNTEGFPSVIQEAMSAGCVVVSTRHGGIPYFITDGKSGILVDEFDLTAYTQILNNLLLDTKLQKSISKNARNDAISKFDYHKLYKKVESIIL